MELTGLKIIVALSLALLPASVSAQGYFWHPVTPEAAAQAVRRFEAKPDLKLKTTFPPTASVSGNRQARVIPLTESITSEADRLCSYSLESERYTYSVNYYSLDEFSFVDNFSPYPDKFYGRHYDIDTLKSMVMSKASAQAIAQAYMSRHYPDPASLNKLTVTPDYGPRGDEPADQRFVHAYQFMFRQDCGNGVLAPAGCFVWVDAIKGQIIGFGSAHYPVLISPAPALTGDEAMAAAMNALNISDGVPRAIENIGIK